MLIFTRNAFLSIVDHAQDDRFLVVRARIAGDIETLFPDAEVFERPGADYRFQATVPRERVSQRVAHAVKEVHYDAFEATVEDGDRRQAYLQVWSAMYEEQARRNELEK
ncbi:MAG: hypothetical protein P4L46_09460 [Fimbriimonas sp.]|nr:hypothetical protein [Fimbriimonas sp.]